MVDVVLVDVGRQQSAPVSTVQVAEVAEVERVAVKPLVETEEMNIVEISLTSM